MYNPSLSSLHIVVFNPRQAPNDSFSSSPNPFNNGPPPSSTTSFDAAPASTSDSSTSFSSFPPPSPTSTSGSFTPSTSEQSSTSSDSSSSSFSVSSSTSPSISLSTAESVALSTVFVTSTSTSSDSSVTTSDSSSTSFTSSSSSSSSSSSFSSSVVTTSPVLQVTQVSTPFDPTPATTLVITADTSAVSASSSVTASGSSLPVEAATSSNGFWSHKSAVAGTFTAVTIAGLALVAGLFLFIRKKRRSYRYSANDEFFSDKYPEPGLLSSSRPPSSNPGSASDFSHAPMDAYAVRETDYYAQQDPFFRSNPATAGGSLPEITYSYAKDVNNQYPYYGNVNAPPAAMSYSTPNLPVKNPFEPSVSSNPFEGPSVPGRRNAPPVTYRDPVVRDSAYPPSIDSFYGTNSHSNVGQAS